MENIQPDQRKITFTAQGDKQTVMADPLLLNNALTNLISNAFKYSAGKKDPEIKLNMGAEYFTITVKDFGIGIPVNEQNKIFQAFHRAENVHAIKGTGLGMFITKNFIELHGGKISFTSIPEKGTKFTVTVPVA